jgi:3-dehydroquinate synthase
MLPEHIVITHSPGSDLQNFLAQKAYTSLAVLTDENTSAHCYPHIKDFLPKHTLIQVKSGEEHKTVDSCQHIWHAMTDAQLDRHAALIIVGGGVLCDMGGFCAATYKRGIDFIFIPTTLLAQADASIGGKLGIDFNDFKNQIGVFQEPRFNLLYHGFLQTLPNDELRSGFAEIVKHALIGNARLWNETLLHPLKKQPWPILLRESAEFKYSIVKQDPHEKGIRKILNAGHTIGHAIETWCLTSGKKILHGDAIAAGLIIESKIAAYKQLLNLKQQHEIERYILSTFGKIELPNGSDATIAELCRQDKKNKGNKILAALLTGIGNAKWDVEINQREIEDSLAYYRNLQT